MKKSMKIHHTAASVQDTRTECVSYIEQYGASSRCLLITVCMNERSANLQPLLFVKAKLSSLREMITVAQSREERVGRFHFLECESWPTWGPDEIKLELDWWEVPISSIQLKIWLQGEQWSHISLLGTTSPVSTEDGRGWGTREAAHCSFCNSLDKGALAPREGSAEKSPKPHVPA